jgi:hypothetical protein
MRAGLLASALVHLILLALYPALTGVPEGLFPAANSPPDDSAARGVELIELREFALRDPILVVDPLPAIESPPPESAPDDPSPDDSAPTADALPPPVGDGFGEEEELTIAERLQPRLGDPRVWAPIPSDYMELSDAENAEIILLGMLQSWNDSMAVAEALSDQARDWTFTDSSGRRWGLGPVRLYLGDFSIPLPAFEFAPGLIEDRLNAGWIAGDLARGAAAAAIQETWSTRARVIRERMEAERIRSGNASDGGGE